MKTRTCIETLTPYEVMEINGVIRLDANESSRQMNYSLSTTLNRYPDDKADVLTRAIAEDLKVSENEVVVGNGSSEMIELLMKTYIEKGDKILGFEKSFSMYKIFSNIYEGDYITVENDYVMDMDALIEKANEINPKMIIICNPNNPTGYLIQKTDIERLLRVYKGLVVIDEAYIEFCEGSMLNRLPMYDQLVILRTFSKAWGLAGARVGYLLSASKIVDDIKKVKAPYSLNSLSQQAALYALQNKNWMTGNVSTVIEERTRVYDELSQLPVKAYRSAANFIYFEGDVSLYNQLIDKGVLIRSFGNGEYRMTLGSSEENTMFINCLKEVISENRTMS